MPKFNRKERKAARRLEKVILSRRSVEPPRFGLSILQAYLCLDAARKEYPALASLGLFDVKYKECIDG